MTIPLEHYVEGVSVRIYRDRVYVKSNHMPPVGTTPQGSGPRESYGLNRKQVTRIRRAVDSLEAEGPTFFVTLTYGTPPGLVRNGSVVNIREDAQAKKDLSNWLKRLKRRHPGVRYAWVAEIQPNRLVTRAERAIHFHLVMNVKPGRMWLNDSWSEVAGEGERLWPHCVPVRKSAGAYMAKYVTKENLDEMTEEEAVFGYIQGNRCGIDQRTSALLKEVKHVNFPQGNWHEIARNFCPEDVPTYVNSDAEFLGIWWGFAYFHGHGKPTDYIGDVRHQPELVGPVHRVEGQVDFGQHDEGQRLPGREGDGSNEVCQHASCWNLSSGC